MTHINVPRRARNENHDKLTFALDHGIIRVAALLNQPFQVSTVHSSERYTRIPQTKIMAPKEEEKQAVKPREYNPRYKGYILIMLSSLINLSAISNIEVDGPFDGFWGFCLSFGCLTFAASVLIMFLDRTQCCHATFNYTKAFDGKFEGYMLLAFTLWWVVGVFYCTQVNGIAYTALNIYFSAWMSLVSCIYTLNKWSAAKDILSIAELTGVSATLKSWYVLFISSAIVTGTSVDLFTRLTGSEQGNAALGFAIGIASTILSFGFILVHYKFLQFCTEGGWIELCSSFLLILMWIVAVAVLTQNEGIAATMVGTGCQSRAFSFIGAISNCTISFAVGQNDQIVSYACEDFVGADIPGSNLYLTVWLCLGTSLSITFRWKAAQALQFAQAQNQRMSRTNMDGVEVDAGLEDDDDLEDFEDAIYE